MKRKGKENLDKDIIVGKEGKRINRQTINNNAEITINCLGVEGSVGGKGKRAPIKIKGIIHDKKGTSQEHC